LTEDKIIQLIHDLSIKKLCYVILDYQDIDGTQIEIEYAVQRCMQGWPAIMIIDKKIAVIETEASFGAPDKYILRAV
jgi:hypothetical protein